MAKSIKNLINLEGKEFKIPELKENPFSDPEVKKIYAKLEEYFSKSSKRSTSDWRYVRNYTFQ